MGLLFMNPRWECPSELWMGRMMRALEPDIVTLATDEPPVALWRDYVPTVAVRPYSQWKKIALRLKAPLRTDADAESITALRRALESPAVDRVLANYLPHALAFQSVWEDFPEKPLFVHCHGYDVTWDLRWYWFPALRYFRSSYLQKVRKLAERATLLANSEHTAEVLLKAGIAKQRVAVKYYGVPAPEEPKLRARRDEINILYLGRLVDFKGPDLLILAFQIACERGLKAQLKIAGDGPMRARCHRLRDRSPFRDRISLLGTVNAATGEALRADADIFTAHNCRGAFSHQEEAFGVSIVEAMADALPVVTGRNGGVTETVVHGQTGLLFESGAVDEHASALLQLAADPDLRERMGIEGWKRARSCFSPERERLDLRRILRLDERHRPLATEDSAK